MKIVAISKDNNSDLIIRNIRKSNEFIIYQWSEPLVFDSLKENIKDCYCIVLCSKDDEWKSFIKCILVSEYEYKEKCIIDFYKIFNAMLPSMIVDKNMEFNNKNIDGLILGISHAEVGILPRYLTGNFVNMAVSSQDIYYNYLILKKMNEKYHDRVSSLNIIIFDLFDYTYFNYDISLSRVAHAYYGWGGFDEDGHNFNNNKNYNFSFDEYINYLNLKKYQGIDDEILDLWDNCFEPFTNEEIDRYLSESMNRKTRYNIVDDDDIEKFKADTAIRVHFFEDTYAENISIFDVFLGYVYKMNPNMRVVLLLMPQYIKTLEKIAPYMGEWEKRFMSMIDDVKSKYPIEFFNFREDEMSTHREYFHDASHLNYYGAYKFTNLLNDLLFNIGKSNM